ncbi:MAG: branched-chain amino acid ABC transporter permease, partial [Rhodoferax sp.]|nr:branched-chain amino acid ABC transporter permease [Rhodoferax sp.]
MTGVAMVKSGLGTAESLLMGLLVFAGSAQLAATPLLLAGAPVWVVLATAFCVNLRFVVFSAHLRPFVMHLPLRQRLVSGYFTADLTYVMFVRRHPHAARNAEGLRAQQAYIAGHGLVNWLSWTVFCVLGIGLSQVIPARWGLGLAGTLALIGILCSLVTSRLRVLAVLAAGVVSVAAYALPFKLNILLAIGVAVVLCLALE